MNVLAMDFKLTNWELCFIKEEETRCSNLLLIMKYFFLMTKVKNLILTKMKLISNLKFLTISMFLRILIYPCSSRDAKQHQKFKITRNNRNHFPKIKKGQIGWDFKIVKFYKWLQKKYLVNLIISTRQTNH